MAEIKSINGYSLKDETARNEIETVKNDYVSKEELPTNVSSFKNDAGYLTNIPSEYVTDSELSAKGYLTKHQSLDGYATEYYVDEKIRMIESVQGPIGPQGPEGPQGPAGQDGADGVTPVKGVDYFTDADKAEMLNGYATEQYVQDAISNLEIPEGEGGGNVDLTGYATEQFVNDAISNIPKEIPTMSGNITDILSFESGFAPEGFCYLSGVSVNHVDSFDGTSMGTISLEDGLYYGRTYSYPELVGRNEVEVKRVDLYSYVTHKTYYFKEYVDQNMGFPTGRIILETEGQSDFVTSSDISYFATKEEVKNNISSTTITRIEVVSALPSTEEDGVLYIVKSE